MSDIEQRLSAFERRLAELAARGLAAGLTEADPDTDERWEAAQVWAHMAEFVGYWHGQIQMVVATYQGEPVPFGRVKSDAGRIAAIDTGRREPLTTLVARATDSLRDLRAYLGSLSTTNWQAVGRHQRVGDMDVGGMVDRFVIGHLEEHLIQLDSLGG